MKSVKNDLAKMFKVFAQTLSEMSEEEFYNLLEGNGKIKYVPSERSSKAGDGKTSSRDLSFLVEKLSSIDTREEAIALLAEQNLLKNDLINLTSLLDIYINKSDGKAKIMEKIVESTVGARIRSKAIRDTQIARP